MLCFLLSSISFLVGSVDIFVICRTRVEDQTFHKSLRSGVYGLELLVLGSVYDLVTIPRRVSKVRFRASVVSLDSWFLTQHIA